MSNWQTGSLDTYLHALLSQRINQIWPQHMPNILDSISSHGNSSSELACQKFE